MGISIKLNSKLIYLAIILHFLNIVKANVLNFMNFNDDELEVHWGYEGITGPEYWGTLNYQYKLCKIGLNQSPINLAKKNLKLIQDDTLKFSFNQDDSSSSTTFEMINNGHSIQINIPENVNYVLTHDKIKYNLQQFHFHSTSEHHVENHDYPFEVHFVYTTPKSILGKQRTHVVGIFAKFGEGDAFIDQFIEYLKDIKEEGSKTTLKKLEIPDLNDFFDVPAWKYTGSLTTPPCTEGVKWLVSNKFMTINLKQLLALKEIMPFNARPTRFNKNVLKGR